jgi:hypothetical protein
VSDGVALEWSSSSDIVEVGVVKAERRYLYGFKVASVRFVGERLCAGVETGRFVSRRSALANFTCRAAVIMELVKVKVSNGAKRLVCSNPTVCVCSIHAPLDVISAFVYSDQICWVSMVFKCKSTCCKLER